MKEDINFLLSGTGCSTVFELRLAFDALKNYMYCNYNDAWDAKKIAKIVSEELYNANSNLPCMSSEIAITDQKENNTCEGAD